MTETTTAERTDPVIGPDPTRSGELVVTSTAGSVAENFDEFELAVRRMLGLEDASDGEMRLFHHVCQRSGLDPLNREVYMIGRNTEVEVWEESPDTKQRRKVSRWVTKYTIQVAIAGFRRRAREIATSLGAEYDVAEPLWCGEDGQWRDVWADKKTPPVAAKFTVFRDGKPNSFVAHYAEFVQTTRSGEPNSMWKKMPANQLRKCAEVGAIQMAFPDQLGGLVSEDSAQPTIIDTSGAPASRPRSEPTRTRGVDALAQRVGVRPDGSVSNTVEEGQAADAAARQRIADRTSGTVPYDPNQVSPPDHPERRKALNNMRRLFAKADIDKDNREDRLICIRAIVGRAPGGAPIDSSNDLTDRELVGLVATLEQLDKAKQLGAKVTDLLNTHALKEMEAEQAATDTSTTGQRGEVTHGQNREADRPAVGQHRRPRPARP